MSWLLLRLIISIHGVNMKFFKFWTLSFMQRNTKMNHHLWLCMVLYKNNDFSLRVLLPLYLLPARSKWSHVKYFFYGLTWTMASSFLKFLDHTQQHTTLGRTPLVVWSARRRDFRLTTHNTHSRKISMIPPGFEPTFSADERTQTYTLDREATGTDGKINCLGNCI